MKTFISTYSKRICLGLLTLVATAKVSAQQMSFASNNLTGLLNGIHTVPNAPTVTIKTPSAVPPATNEEYTATSEIDIAGNVVENHLLIMTVRTQKNNLTTAIYDENGTRLTYETFIDAGSYRMIDHTRNLKAGTYYLYVMENGKVIEKEKFLIK